jgi:hypothetical protein
MIFEFIMSDGSARRMMPSGSFENEVRGAPGLLVRSYLHFYPGFKATAHSDAFRVVASGGRVMAAVHGGWRIVRGNC